jgi:hypothetical protein
MLFFLAGDYPVFLAQTREGCFFFPYPYKAMVNPTIASYNASIVNFYNGTGSLAHFKNKNILFYFEKCSRLLQRWRCSCKLKNRRIGSRRKFLNRFSGQWEKIMPS